MNVAGSDITYWLLMPVVAAMGSAALVWLLMQARVQVLRSKYEAALNLMENRLELQASVMHDTVQNARAAAHQAAVDEVLADIRVEQSRLVRGSPGPSGREQRLIIQERVFLRNIPLSSWIVHEIALDPAGGFTDEIRALPGTHQCALQTAGARAPGG